jgi:hypothetical protein
MQKVLRNIFLIDDKLENNLKFWVLIGPYLLFLSVTLATFELAIVTAAGLFLCYRFKFKGLFIALLTLAIYSFYTQVNLEEKHLWNLGLQVSIALGLVISTYGFDDIKSYLHKDTEDQNILNLKQEIKEKQINFEKSKRNLEENLVILKEALNKKSEKINIITQENSKLKQDLQDNLHRKDYLLNELDHKVKEIEEMRTKQDELYEKISFLKDEEHLQEENKSFRKEIEKLNQTSHLQKEEKEKVLNELNQKIEIINSLEKQLLQTQSLEKSQNVEELEQKLKQKENEIKRLKEKQLTLSNLKNENITDADLLKEYENKMKEFNHLNSLYNQLKSQFEEKQSLLHKTRQELFQAKEKLTAYQKEQDQDYNDLSDCEKAVLLDLDKTIEDLKKYKKENQNLEDIITELLKE